MTTAMIIHLAIMFVAKVADNMLATAKMLFVQRNKSLLAGVSLALSNWIYLMITKDVIMADDGLSLVIVSVASGVGCCLAIAINNKFSRDRTYVNILMSDDMNAMIALRDFLAKHHIRNVAVDAYTKDWSKKTITITAYAETKEESRLIDEYLTRIAINEVKIRRIIQKG